MNHYDQAIELDSVTTFENNNNNNIIITKTVSRIFVGLSYGDWRYISKAISNENNEKITTNGFLYANELHN